MICPKCGSENVQFSTNTSGGGYKAGSGCCGYMILGPLGLLCGACGSGSTTTEFWICNQCGHRFDNFDAKEALKIAEKCKKYKNELKQPLGSYRYRYQDAEKALSKANEEYEQEFNKCLEKYSLENEEVAKYKKKYSEKHIMASIIITVIIIFGALFSIGGIVPLGIPMLIGGIIAIIIRKLNRKKLTERIEVIFKEKNPDFQKFIDKKENAKKEQKRWKKLLEKANYVEKHDK